LNQTGVFEKADGSGGTRSQDRRKRGEGHIGQRGCIWWIRYYVNSCRVDESSHSPKKDAAERLLAKRRAEIEADTFVGPVARRLRHEQIRDALYADYQANHRKWLRIGKDAKTYICGVSHLDGFFAGQRVLPPQKRPVVN
jgi:hypothetical protein